MGLKNNRRSVFLTLLLSYILVILFTVFMGGLLYKKVEYTIKDNTNRYNLAMLEQVRQVMDGSLKEIDQITYQISFNPQIQNILGLNFSLGQPDVYRYVDLIKELKQYKSRDDFVYDFYVYFNKDDVVVNMNTKDDSTLFYNSIYKYKELDYSQWLNLLNSYHFKTYLPAMTVESGITFEDVITYIQSLPYGEKNNINGSIVILINESNVKKLLENIKLANSGYICILDNRNQIIMSTSDNSKLSKIKYSDLKKDADIFEQNIDGSNMMISYSTSVQNGWKYVSMVPKNIFMEGVNRIKAWAIGILFCYLVGGLVLAYIMAYKNYSPVKNLIDIIKNAKEIKSARILNEYDFITGTIQNELNETKNLTEIIHQQIPVVKNDFLCRLIKGYINYSDITVGSLDLMGIHFISDYFAILLVDVEDSSRFSEENSESKWTMIRIMLTNTVESLSNEYNNRYTVELERNRLAIMINFRNDRINNAAADMGNAAKELKDILENKFSIFITVGISNVHDGLRCMEEAFKEASKAIDYKIVTGMNKIVYFADLKDTEQYYYYPLEVEMKLMNFVKTGDFESVEKILDDVYQENFKSHHIIIEIGQCLFFNIISTLIKVMNSVNVKVRDVLEDKYALIKQLATCSTVEEMHVKTKSIYKNICDYIKANQNSSSQLLDGIINHIGHNITESTLSLVSIADKFNITPQYLSVFFKNNNGLNISDYIAKARVDKVKVLLEDKTLTLADIAQNAGFTSEASFIRVFKKYEGVTPGKYRDKISLH